jgi:hypothetical protein
MTSEFETVANGSRRRARWRCGKGWMRVERLSDHHLRVRGPHSELQALARAVSSDWICMQPGAQAVASDTAEGMFELTLVRNPTPVGERQRSGSRRGSKPRPAIASLAALSV